MFTAEEMAEHRADAESLMQDRFAAFAPGPPTTAGSGMKQAGWALMGLTAGKTQAGSSASRDLSVRRVTIGGAEFDVVESGLHIPLGAFIADGVLALRIGWEFQCTAVGLASDPAQLGRRWHVVKVPTKSLLTARRLDVAEVPSLVIKP